MTYLGAQANAGIGVVERWPNLPIILATGYAELPEGSAKEVLRLPKPFGRADLVRVVETAVAW